MEKVDVDEHENASPRSNSVSSSMAAYSTSSPESSGVGVAFLQYQNQKLVQQLETQKHDLQDLEDKIRQLKNRQSAYDETLVSMNQLRNQLVNHLILFILRVGQKKVSLSMLDHLDRSRVCIPQCPVEDIFLCRLLEKESAQGCMADVTAKDVEEFFSLRQSSICELMKMLEDAVSMRMACINSIPQVLDQTLSDEDVSIYVAKIGDLMKTELHSLDEVIQNLRLKHQDYINDIQSYKNSILMDQSEIKRLAGELEERMAELEECRRKLVNLKMQNSTSGVCHLGTVNGNLSSEKHGNKAMGVQDLKYSVEEAKVLADDRLSELQGLQDEVLGLSKQLKDLQDDIQNNAYVCSSRPYSLLTDQLQHWKADVERYKALTDTLQADRPTITEKESELESAVTQKENELSKGEAVDSVRDAFGHREFCIKELDHQLQTIIMEKNELEIKMEESIHDSARKDVKEEFDVVASSLTKEIAMMEARVNHWKETAREAVSLREKTKELKAVLNRKESERKAVAHKCEEQSIQIKSLKSLIENLKKESLEKQNFIDLHMQQLNDSRDLAEIKESEQKARLQAEVLGKAVNEHSLELRVKAANEAETACKERLTAAEAEIENLRPKLDASLRDTLELNEAIKVKDTEMESYITEIEIIGQAYEDMQAQNQHLLQKMMDRDDYNIKLVSESVKSKQTQNVLVSQKQVLSSKLEQVNASMESLKTRISSSGEKMKNYLADAEKALEEGMHFSTRLETAKWELADAEKEFKWLKSAIGSVDKDHENMQLKKKDIQVLLEIERGERRRMEEELGAVNKEMEGMSSEVGETAIQKLQKEIYECKTILKCSVCFDRPKEVVIVKCYHIFCNQCIQRNLEMRHRRCPGCGTPFGQSDVRFVNI